MVYRLSVIPKAEAQVATIATRLQQTGLPLVLGTDGHGRAAQMFLTAKWLENAIVTKRDT
jgi:histidinol phosphatase-like PHP family hydrolase